MAQRNIGPYDFFVLTYTDGEFEAVAVSKGNFSSLSLAKVYALSALGFGETDVPIIMDRHSVMHFYHP